MTSLLVQPVRATKAQRTTAPCSILFQQRSPKLCCARQRETGRIMPSLGTGTSKRADSGYYGVHHSAGTTMPCSWD
ncbi:hypothetical protein WJX72_008424 [[Myrmecia] bisecta]|uniref:Uncharacterized protein n=1 Tax=[Myrmecia] bisecta TaxID=41462 RepID=A0AAW1PYD3_9CHLO